jgi:hypothetical protein
MTPTDAKNIMKPFFPNDPNLAAKALGRALNEGTTPEWIVNSVVGSYFSFLALKELNDFARKHDPFGWDTVVYLSNIHKGENKN